MLLNLVSRKEDEMFVESFYSENLPPISIDMLTLKIV